jgi:spermidine synthase
VTGWDTLATARTAHGDELLLRERCGIFELRMNGRELMSSRAHFSEEAMARLGCADLAACAGACVLIGGLGMGYTLRAALDLLPATARLLVVELLAEVAAWNHGALGALAQFPLDDSRVEIRLDDVANVIGAARQSFDAILLDIDNGPTAPVRSQNRALFGSAGLRRIREALRPGGRLAVWSAEPWAAFELDLTAAGYDVCSVDVPALGHAGPLHRIYLATAGSPFRHWTTASPHATSPA